MGMRNKDIQFLFNRPDRAVNSGRISGIKSGSYANSKDIEPASEADVQEYVGSIPKSQSPAVIVPITGIVDDPLPGSKEELLSLFEKQPGGNWRFMPGETQRHECKKSFSMSARGAWVKAVAGLANNEGGWLVFGVVDPSDPSATEAYHQCRANGANPLYECDPKDVSQRLRGCLDPTPSVSLVCIELDEVKIAAIYVEASVDLPVVVSKADNGIKEGDIYFRYPAETARVKHADLISILNRRDAQAARRMLPLIEEIIQARSDGVAVMNLSSGELVGLDRRISVDPDLTESVAKTLSVRGSDKPRVVISGALQQESSSGRTSIRDLLVEYPYSATDLKDAVKEALPGAKQNDIWAALRCIKGDSQYSAYNFANAKKERDALASGFVPPSTSTIYNAEAVKWIIARLKEG